MIWKIDENRSLEIDTYSKHINDIKSQKYWTVLREIVYGCIWDVTLKGCSGLFAHRILNVIVKMFSYMRKSTTRAHHLSEYDIRYTDMIYAHTAHR